MRCGTVWRQLLRKEISEEQKAIGHPAKSEVLCRNRHFAKFIARVSFSTAIFAAMGAGEAAKDDSITDATCFRERKGAGSDRDRSLLSI